jgi:hypothetical protein
MQAPRRWSSLLHVTRHGRSLLLKNTDAAMRIASTDCQIWGLRRQSFQKGHLIR